LLAVTHLFYHNSLKKKPSPASYAKIRSGGKKSGDYIMAKTEEGKKIVPVEPYKRAKPGETKKTVKVKRHRRSTPI